jgi:hypothetical protein
MIGQALRNYTLVHGPFALIAVQLLDGIGAGIFGVLFFLVIADLTKGQVATTLRKVRPGLVGGSALR